MTMTIAPGQRGKDRPHTDSTARMGMLQLQAALDDVRQSLKRLRLAFYLGWRESILPYRAARIGPFWMMLQTALWAGAIGYFLAPSAGRGEPSYYVYVTVGIALYSTFLIFISEGASVFVREKNLILNVPNPFLIYVLKIAAKALIQVVMTIPIIILSFLVAGLQPNGMILLAIPALVLLFLFGIGVTLTLGTLGVRFRDVIFATQAAMRLMLFVTPIFWIVEQRHGARRMLAEINPLYHFISIVRDPIMGKAADMHHWNIALASTVMALMLGFLLFAYYRGRIAIWL